MKTKILLISTVLLISMTGFITKKNYIASKKLLCDKEWRPITKDNLVSEIKISYSMDNIYSMKLDNTEINGIWFFDDNNRIHLKFYSVETNSASELIASVIKINSDTLTLLYSDNKLMTYVWNQNGSVKNN